MKVVSFWVQIRGVPPYLNLEENVRSLATKIWEFEEFEDPSKARGFLKVKVAVNTLNLLTIGCWLPRDNNNDTWIKFRYERLKNFCYRCGRIGHFNTECSFEPMKGGTAGYEEWTKVAPI